jgi:hypothetical protein
VETALGRFPGGVTTEAIVDLTETRNAIVEFVAAQEKLEDLLTEAKPIEPFTFATYYANVKRDLQVKIAAVERAKTAWEVLKTFRR